jgi:hypothetical protein
LLDQMRPGGMCKFDSSRPSQPVAQRKIVYNKIAKIP